MGKESETRKKLVEDFVRVMKRRGYEFHSPAVVLGVRFDGSISKNDRVRGYVIFMTGKRRFSEIIPKFSELSESLVIKKFVVRYKKGRKLRTRIRMKLKELGINLVEF